MVLEHLKSIKLPTTITGSHNFDIFFILNLHFKMRVSALFKTTIPFLPVLIYFSSWKGPCPKKRNLP